MKTPFAAWLQDDYKRSIGQNHEGSYENPLNEKKNAYFVLPKKMKLKMKLPKKLKLMASLVSQEGKIQRTEISKLKDNHGLRRT